MLNLGDRITFHVRDVYLPGPREVLAALTEEIEVAGTIIELSDSGAQAGVFAVIGIGENQRVIVPVSKLHMAG